MYHHITGEYLGNIENKQIDIDTIKTIKFFEESAVDGEIIDKNISISPNPATDYIEIKQPSEGFKPSEGSAIKIYNVLGIEHPVSFAATPLSEGNLRLDVSSLPAGVYFVRVGSRMLKFVKM